MRPRSEGGETSATYIGERMDAPPTASPPMKRASTKAVKLGATPVPMEVTENSGRPAADAALFLPLPAAGDPRVLPEVPGGDESRRPRVSVQYSGVHQRDHQRNGGGTAFHRTLRRHQRLERRLGQLPGPEPLQAGAPVHAAGGTRRHLRAGPREDGVVS